MSRSPLARRATTTGFRVTRRPGIGSARHLWITCPPNERGRYRRNMPQMRSITARAALRREGFRDQTAGRTTHTNTRAVSTPKPSSTGGPADEAAFCTRLTQVPWLRRVHISHADAAHLSRTSENASRIENTSGSLLELFVVVRRPPVSAGGRRHIWRRPSRPVWVAATRELREAQSRVHREVLLCGPEMDAGAIIASLALPNASGGGNCLQRSSQSRARARPHALTKECLSRPAPNAGVSRVFRTRYLWTPCE